MKVADSIRNLVPYQPGKPIEETKREYGLKEVIKLASNENTLGMNPNIVKALKAHLGELHRYPDGGAFEVKKAASAYYQVEPENLALGNGSDELIALLIRIYCNPGQGILIPEKAFVAYKVAALGAGVSVTESPIHPDLTMNIPALLSSWREEHSLVFIANPNNPTGSYLNVIELTQILEFFKDKEVLVCVDEAYFEFVRAEDYPNAIDLQKKYRNLISLRTMSKAFGLAGLRLGFLIAAPEITDLVNRVRSPFNVNSLAQIAAVTAFMDHQFLRNSVRTTWEGLLFLEQAFKKLEVSFHPSQGNFLLVDLKRPAREVFEAMLKKGVILRPVGNYGLPNHMRISVGMPDENKKMILALREVLMQEST